MEGAWEGRGRVENSSSTNPAGMKGEEQEGKGEEERGGHGTVISGTLAATVVFCWPCGGAGFKTNCSLVVCARAHARTHQHQPMPRPFFYQQCLNPECSTVNPQHVRARTNVHQQRQHDDARRDDRRRQPLIPRLCDLVDTARARRVCLERDRACRQSVQGCKGGDECRDCDDQAALFAKP
eukprot:365689-Chlamydomonas_euryale.AAC.7